MDKYDLINILHAAADGIAGIDASKELKLKNESYKAMLYNFCKVAVVNYFNRIDAAFNPTESDIISSIGVGVNDFDDKPNQMAYKKLADRVFTAMTNEKPPTKQEE